nr:PREDICTED: regulator of G-protein signaling protein-like [Balearica regulorum gibbericeps]
MMATATIASTDLGLLLRDDVFVDFFNTFLNLPVFGQTPIYISSTGQWHLWPELPSRLVRKRPFHERHLQRSDPVAKGNLFLWCCRKAAVPSCLGSGKAGGLRGEAATQCLGLPAGPRYSPKSPGKRRLLAHSLILSLGAGVAMQDPSPPALLAWLKKHRLPHFCKSSLCLHLVLCQKLLGFIRSGEAGEELTNFWLTTERLLGLDESDTRQRDLYLSLLCRLKATHLREGSSVVTLCRTIAGSLPKPSHVQPISTRREILSKMQEQALFMIQSYWLPKFFIHCKMGMEEEKSCQPLLQEYRERLLQANLQEPSDFSENVFMMHIKRSQGLSGPYCSKKAKAEIWTLVNRGRDTQEMKMPSFQVQPGRQLGPAGSTRDSHPDKGALGPIPQQSEHPANTAFGGKGEATSPKRPRPSAEQVLHPEYLSEEKVLSNLRSSAPLAQLPSLKKPVKTLSFLPWALSADCCAGRPFRDFLNCQDRSVETLLLDLWHDLEEFLPVVLDPSTENSFFLRRLIGEKICKTYLEEGTIQQLPLETRTIRSLRDHLMSGEFSPWIFRAQKEICKVLCCFYEEFLADDDRTFLQFMSLQSDVPMPKMQGHAVGKNVCFLLSERINASLKLSQALHGTRHLEGLSSECWRLIATRDLRKGGSLQAEVEHLLYRTDSQKMISNKLAAGSPSKENELLFLKSPSLGESSLSRLEAGHFVKVLHNPAHLQFFKQFLEERNADEPLHFWMAVEKLVSETNPKTKNLLINNIVRNYFHAEIPAEELLDCHTSIIKEINEAEVVSPFMLMTAQVFVQKAMEKRWFKEYQDLFPPGDMHKSNLCLRRGMRNFTTDKLQWGWYAIHDIVRSICKFRREMDNDKRRVEFEGFLRQELGNEEENLPISSMQSSSTTSTFCSRTASASTPPDKEVVLVKRYLFNNQLITVNFLVDDLRFYLEINKFSRLADSVEALAARNMQSEKEVAFLKRKVAIISKLFLNSDIPPKLRVNISEEERDFIWSLSSKGLLNRILYHRAKVIIFPILMHFWRRFCIWKVMRSFQVSAKDREPISSPSSKASSESSEVYSPDSHTTIVFTLLKGVQVLLPQPQRTMELLEEQRGQMKK